MNTRTVSTKGLLVGVFIAAIAAGALAAVLVVRYLPLDSKVASQIYPLTEAAESFSCAAGLERAVMLRGVEDGFAPAGDEPSTIDPRLLKNGFFADLAEGLSSAVKLRNYDEGGSDQVLVDHFVMPRGIVSGKLVLRLAPAGKGAVNDGLRIGNLDIASQPDDYDDRYTFGLTNIWSDPGLQKLDDGSFLLSLDMASMKSLARGQKDFGTLFQYLNRTERVADLDLTLGDDTKVDAIALLACQLPANFKGVTFSESRSKSLGSNLSLLGCGIDPTQHGCDPFAGDRLCSEPGPVACYRDGGKTAPQDMFEKGGNPASFVGGEVRLSAPVRGDRFPHLGDANVFCQQQFGREWRVLSYHEGGGGSVISYSQIAPRSRGLVNIRDQQYGNCWDRDLPR